MKIKQKNIILKNGQTILLRSVSPLDTQNMLNHLIITHNESYKNMNQTADHWVQFPPEQEEKILADFESSNSKFMLVALYEDKIIGGMGCVGAQGQFHKKNITLGMSIQKGFSNLGLGTAMMIYAIEIAKSMGFNRMDLTVRDFNTAAITLYEKIGFKRTGTFNQIAFIDGNYHNEYSYELILK